MAARKVKDYDFRSERKFRNRRYPWEQWMNGDIWELSRGKDFTVKGDSVRSAAYAWAKSNGYRVSVSVSADKNTVCLHAVPAAVHQGWREDPEIPRFGADENF